MSCYVSPFGSGGGIEGPEQIQKSGTIPEEGQITIWTATDDCLVRTSMDLSNINFYINVSNGTKLTASQSSASNYRVFPQSPTDERVLSITVSGKYEYTLILVHKGEYLSIEKDSKSGSYSVLLTVYHFK